MLHSLDTAQRAQQDRHHRAVLLSCLFEELSGFITMRAAPIQDTLTEALVAYVTARPTLAPEAVRHMGHINNLIRVVCANADLILDSYEHFERKAERLEIAEKQARLQKEVCHD